MIHKRTQVKSIVSGTYLSSVLALALFGAVGCSSETFMKEGGGKSASQLELGEGGGAGAAPAGCESGPICETQSSADLQDESADNAGLSDESGDNAGLSDEEGDDAALADIPGWKESVCPGSLFASFPAPQAGQAFALGGWSQVAGSEIDGLPFGEQAGDSLISKFEECLDFSIEDSKRQQYVVVELDPEDFSVVSAKPFSPDVFPGVNAADYGRCATEFAGAPAANRSVPDLPVSMVQEFGSCGPTACCVKVR